MLNGLDLFSGIGGLEQALAPWVRPVAYCEIQRKPQGTLLERMESGDIAHAPIWDDIKTLEGRFLPEIDIIYGGFPCQDLSVAGARKGLDGERSGLFFEIIRLVRECGPEYVFMENSPNITVLGLDRVLLELNALGYDARWTIISAEEVGAPFLGERWFLLAKAMCGGHRDMDQPQFEPRSVGQADAGCDWEAVAAAFSIGRRKRWAELMQLRNSENVGHCSAMVAPSISRLERAQYTRKSWAAFREHRHSSRKEWPQWLPEPALPRGHDGLSGRVERIKESGNAVVWLQGEEAFMRLIGLDRMPSNQSTAKD